MGNFCNHCLMVECRMFSFVEDFLTFLALQVELKRISYPKMVETIVERWPQCDSKCSCTIFMLPLNWPLQHCSSIAALYFLDFIRVHLVRNQQQKWRQILVKGRFEIFEESETLFSNTFENRYCIRIL